MKYLKVFTDFVEDMKELGDAERGRLFTGMLEYAETGKEPDLRGNERFVWGTAKKNIDNQRKSYDHQCAVNKANGSEPKRKQANGSEPIQEKDKEQDKDQKNRKKKAFIPPTIEEVRAYCAQRNSTVDPDHFYHIYNSQGWIKGNGAQIKNWKSTIITWEQKDKEKQQPERIDKTANLKKLYDELGDD